MSSYGFCFQVQVEPQVSEDERKKYEQEFSDYQKKLEQAKEEWVGCNEAHIIHLRNYFLSVIFISFRRDNPDARFEDEGSYVSRSTLLSK